MKILLLIIFIAMAFTGILLRLKWMKNLNFLGEIQRWVSYLLIAVGLIGATVIGFYYDFFTQLVSLISKF